jgi:hypothetical protein
MRQPVLCLDWRVEWSPTMKLKPLIVLFALSFAAPAGAGWFDAIKGNDTGGIIPWAFPPPDYRGIAMTHCGTYNKIAVITSLPRQYGDYAGFICTFPHGYDPVRGQLGVVPARGIVISK